MLLALGGCHAKQGKPHPEVRREGREPLPDHIEAGSSQEVVSTPVLEATKQREAEHAELMQRGQAIEELFQL